MDYGRRELADRLAAEYVLGTLRGPARRRFESLLTAHPALREATSGWQARLDALSGSVAPVAPPARVWQAIDTRLFGVGQPTAPWWQRLGPWRALTGVATLSLAAMLFVVQQPVPVAVPVMVVLAANPQAAGATQARFVASLSPDGRALVLRPIDAPQLSARQALELWAVPATGAPRSLGLVHASQATTLIRAQPLGDAAALAISVEPPGGSPTGAPTGPIISLGQVQS